MDQCLRLAEWRVQVCTIVQKQFDRGNRFLGLPLNKTLAKGAKKKGEPRLISYSILDFADFLIVNAVWISAMLKQCPDGIGILILDGRQ